MTVTETLRKVIIKSGTTHYRINKDTGVGTSIVNRFVSGEFGIRGATIDKLAEYFTLELVEKKQKKSAKQATKRRRKTVPQPKTRGA